MSQNFYPVLLSGLHK